MFPIFPYFFSSSLCSIYLLFRLSHISLNFAPFHFSLLQSCRARARRSSGSTRACIRAAARALCSFLFPSGCVASLGKCCIVDSSVNATMQLKPMVEPLHQLCSPQSPGVLQVLALQLKSTTALHTMFVSLSQWLCCLFRQVLYSSWFCKCDWSLWLSPFISCAHHSLQVSCSLVVSSCNIISCAHHSLQVCCKCLPCIPNRLLRFTGYEPWCLIVLYLTFIFKLSLTVSASPGVIFSRKLFVFLCTIALSDLENPILPTFSTTATLQQLLLCFLSLPLS